MNKTYYMQIEGKTFEENNKSNLILDEHLFGTTTVYKNCYFQDYEHDQMASDADFENCTFKNVFYYWTLFNITEFTECTFENCTFAGVTFADCKLIKCTFNNCKFIKDNLGGDCHFDDSIACQCDIDKVSSVGFNIQIDDAYEKKVVKIEEKNRQMWLDSKEVSKEDKQLFNAHELERQHKYKEALKIYKKITKDADDPRYYISYGVCLQNLGHWEQASKQLEKGILLKPHYCYGDAILFLAESYLKMKQFKKAIKQWEIAKKLEPMYPSYEYVKNEANRMLQKWGSKKR